MPGEWLSSFSQIPDLEFLTIVEDSVYMRNAINTQWIVRRLKSAAWNLAYIPSGTPEGGNYLQWDDSQQAYTNMGGPFDESVYETPGFIVSTGDGGIEVMPYGSAGLMLSTGGGTDIMETSNVSFTGGSITGMPAPVAGGDVANKTYVDEHARLDGSDFTGSISAPSITVGSINGPGGDLYINNALYWTYFDGRIHSTFAGTNTFEGTLAPLAVNAAYVTATLELSATNVNLNSGTMSGVSITGGSITGLSLPSADTDAASKIYVDAMAAGLIAKEACRVATTANIALTGTQTIDGVAVTAGQRVLVKNQSTTSQNGIYVCAAGAWSRSVDANESAEVRGGMYCWVNEGTLYADTGWAVTSSPVTLGTDAVTFTQVSGLGQISVVSPILKSGNQLSFDSSTIANAQNSADLAYAEAGYAGSAADAAQDSANNAQSTADLAYALVTTSRVFKTFFAGPVSGSNAAPTFRAIELTDLPDDVMDDEYTYVNYGGL